VELRGFEPLTPCMPCSFGHLPHPRSETGHQPNDLLRVTVAVRWIPLVTAAYGTRVARKARTTMVGRGGDGFHLNRRVRPILGDPLPRWQAANAARQARCGWNPPGYVAGHGRRSPGSLSVMSNDMVIVFQRGNEAPEAFPLGKPGGNISIAWGEPTRRAAIWKVVANPNGDVYVMERKTGRYLKASLHKKVWRYAWVERAVEWSPMVESFVEMTGDRVIDRWDRPQALPGGTLTIGYTIFTTGEDIRMAKDDPKVTGKVGWLPPPTVGEMAYFTVTLMKPNRQHIELCHALPVAAFSMKSGEALLITATRRAIKPEEKEQLRVVRQRLALARPTHVANMPDSAEPRALMHGQNDFGGRHVFDFAL
jgi:hypothetical protein